MLNQPIPPSKSLGMEQNNPIIANKTNPINDEEQQQQEQQQLLLMH